MNEIKIGSNSEFIKIEVPLIYSDEGWAQTSVEVKTSNFYGAINPWVESKDFQLFSSSLSILYNTLRGSASFECTEGQFALKLESLSGGQIEISGFAWSEACYGSKLEFCFSLDQTFLQEPLKKLEAIILQIKANA